MRRILGLKNPVIAWALALLLLVAVAVTDGITGYEASLLVFYFVPVVIVAWSRGALAALLASLLAATAWWLADTVSGHQYSHALVSYWNAFMRLLLFGLSGYFVAHLRQALDEKDAFIRELQLSLSQIKTLAGHVPICPTCRRILAAQNNWQDLETYVREKSHIEFLSVLCPACHPDPSEGEPGKERHSNTKES